MVHDDLQHRLRRKETQIGVFLVSVDYPEHPEDRGWVDHFLLVGCLVLDVEIDHIEQLVEDAPILRIEERLEDVHEKLLAACVQVKLPLIELIVEHVDREHALFLFSQGLLGSALFLGLTALRARLARRPRLIRRPEIQVGKVELAQVPCGFLSAGLVGFLGQPQQTVQTGVLLLYTLPFPLGAEGRLGLLQPLTDEAQVFLAGLPGRHLDIVLDLGHYMRARRSVGREGAQGREGPSAYFERLLSGEVHEGVQDVAESAAEFVLELASARALGSLRGFGLCKDQAVAYEERKGCGTLRFDLVRCLRCSIHKGADDTF